MKDQLMPALVGAGAGALAGVVLWLAFRGIIDQQVSATIAREVPPRLRSELDAKLASYGITPAMGQSVARMLTSFDQAGVFQALGQPTR